MQIMTRAEEIAERQQEVFNRLANNVIPTLLQAWKDAPYKYQHSDRSYTLIIPNAELKYTLSDGETFTYDMTDGRVITKVTDMLEVCYRPISKKPIPSVINI